MSHSQTSENRLPRLALQRGLLLVATVVLACGAPTRRSRTKFDADDSPGASGGSSGRGGSGGAGRGGSGGGGAGGMAGMGGGSGGMGGGLGAGGGMDGGMAGSGTTDANAARDGAGGAPGMGGSGAGGTDAARDGAGGTPGTGGVGMGGTGMGGAGMGGTGMGGMVMVGIDAASDAQADASSDAATDGQTDVAADVAPADAEPDAASDATVDVAESDGALDAADASSVDAATDAAVDAIGDAVPAATSGLRGEYFDNRDLTNLKLVRVDPVVDFSWGAGASPDPSIAGDDYSVRWTGSITPTTTDTYLFCPYSNDGVRVFVNGMEVAQDLGNHAGRYPVMGNLTPIMLTANQAYDIRVEWDQGAATAEIRLRWANGANATCNGATLVPSSVLKPPAAGLIGYWKPDNAANPPTTIKPPITRATAWRERSRRTQRSTGA